MIGVGTFSVEAMSGGGWLEVEKMKMAVGLHRTRIGENAWQVSIDDLLCIRDLGCSGPQELALRVFTLSHPSFRDPTVLIKHCCLSPGVSERQSSFSCEEVFWCWDNTRGL